MQNNIRGKVIIASLLVMGFSGIVAQILCLREFLVIFSGNELSIGIILANWLILEAFGAFFLGKRAERIKQKLEAFVSIQLIFSISLPCMYSSTRILLSYLKASFTASSNCFLSLTLLIPTDDPRLAGLIKNGRPNSCLIALKSTCSESD